MKGFKVLNRGGKERRLHVGSTPAPEGIEGVAVGIILWDPAAARFTECLEGGIATCAQAEAIAAKLLESAWVARHQNGEGPRPTFGPKGRQKMLARLGRTMSMLR